MPADPVQPAAHIDYLDGWRGLAICLVLVGHFGPVPWIDAGRLGVDVFFCLSGLLISRLLFVQRTPLARFYKRGISRILPAFLLFVASVHVLALIRHQPWTMGQLASTLVFLRTYLPTSPDIWHTGMPLGHLWSLNVEEHCYVLMSLLTLIPALRRREGWALIALGLASMATYRYYARHATPGESFEIRTEAAAACLMASAGYSLVRARLAPHVAPWMPALAFAVAVPAYLHAAPWWASPFVGPALLVFTVNHLDRLPAAARAMLEFSPLRRMGVWSYSIYLWQQPFYEERTLFFRGMALAGAMVMGTASFHLLEDPLRRWLNKRW